MKHRGDTNGSVGDASAPRVVPDSTQRTVLYRAAAALLMDSLDYETTLAAVAGLALPEIGSWSIVDLCEKSGSMRRLAIVHPDAAMQRLARRLERSWPPRTEDPIGAPIVVRTKEPEVVSEVSDAMLVEFARDEENLALLRELGIGSFLVVPLTARLKVLGAITFVSKAPGRRYKEQDLALAGDLAALGGLAIDRANLYSDSESARTLATDRADFAERQQRDLEHIMEIQARLVRGFSHDVKNPLGAAQGYALLLEGGLIDTLTPKQMVSVTQISSSIGDALTLIDQLVEYAKSKMGRVEIQRGPTDVARVSAEIVDEYRAQVEAAGLKLELEVLPGVEPIHSDRTRIRQILGNLLSNAVKYTDRGTVRVRLEAHRDGEAPWAGGWITVAVSDTGHGISQPDQRLIFQEFARLEPATTQGSGLGLAISQWIADALGARITLVSEVGHGSTFTVWLPALREGQEIPPSLVPAA